MDLVERTKVGRDVNRHQYSLDEAITELDRPVVKVRVRLLRQVLALCVRLVDDLWPIQCKS